MPRGCAPPMHDIDQPGGNVEFPQQFAELDRVVRCLLAGFNHNRVSRNQRRARLPRDQEKGKVPGQNSADHTNWPPEKEDGLTFSVAFENLALDAAAPL